MARVSASTLVVLLGLSVSLALSACAGAQGARQILTVVSLEAELADGEGRLLLPGDFLEGFRAKLETDEALTCLSVNLQEGKRRLWVPIRRDTDAAVLIPGGGVPRFTSLDLQLAERLPRSVRALRLFLGDGRSVQASVVTRDRIRIEPTRAALSGIDQEAIVGRLVAMEGIAWRRTRTVPPSR